MFVRQNREGVYVFSVQLSLERYRLPGDALVFVEASRGLASFMRFPWGRVRGLEPATDRRLTEFGTANGVKFRVKVVEETGGDKRPARVLALADEIRAVKNGSERQPLSLLEIVPADLAHELWKIDFSGDDEPQLQINQSLVTSPAHLVRDDHFVSLVLPQVLRAVLLHILIVNRFDALEERTGWRAQWLRFSVRLPGVGDGPPRVEVDEAGALQNEDELEQWIDDAVRAFARKFHIGRQFNAWWNAGEAT